MMNKYFIIAIVVLVVICAFQYNSISKMKRSAVIDKQNISALNDTLKIEKKKNGEVSSSIDGYIANLNQLRTLNNMLWNNIVEEKGKVLSMSSTVLRLQQDSAKLASLVDSLKAKIGTIKVNDSTFYADWTLPYKYDTSNYDTFYGRTVVTGDCKDGLSIRHKQTYMLNRDSKISLTFGQKVEDGKLRVFINTKYPGLQAESLQGVLIDPSTNPFFKDLMKKKHWFNGWSVGPSISVGWSITDARPSLVVGASIQYSIYTW